tara:strand:+ start:47045 stop:47167 length:123 start_codon:yes stop_codon:yes gene_type:complete
MKGILLLGEGFGSSWFFIERIDVKCPYTEKAFSYFLDLDR